MRGLWQQACPLFPRYTLRQATEAGIWASNADRFLMSSERALIRKMLLTSSDSDIVVLLYSYLRG